MRRAEGDVVATLETMLAGVDLRAIRRIGAVAAVVVLVVVVVVGGVLVGGGVVIVVPLDVGVAGLIAVGIVDDPADDVAAVVDDHPEEAEDVAAVGVALGAAVADAEERIAAAADQVDHGAVEAAAEDIAQQGGPGLDLACV